MKTFTSLLCGLAFALSSVPALAALSPFGCDGGITTVYTLSLEPAASAPVFANSAVCGPVEDARSTADGSSINVASLGSDAGVTLGAGVAVLGEGLSTQSYVQGGAIYDFIPRRMDGQSGLGEITYIARATLLEHTFSAQGLFTRPRLRSAKLTRTGISSAPRVRSNCLSVPPRRLASTNMKNSASPCRSSREGVTSLR